MDWFFPIFAMQVRFDYDVCVGGFAVDDVARARLESMQPQSQIPSQMSVHGSTCSRLNFGAYVSSVIPCTRSQPRSHSSRGSDIFAAERPICLAGNTYTALKIAMTESTAFDSLSNNAA